MKILHCCLANFYMEKYGYQENIITKIHKLQGNDVAIVASTEIYVKNQVLGYTIPSTSINEHKIPVKRIPYVKWLPLFIVKRLRLYKNLKDILNEFKPQIIFIHGTQFLSIQTIANYAKKNKSIRIYADCHADYVNSGRNWISLNILHRIIYKYCAQKINPFTIKFYGTLPARCKFLNEVYNIPTNKIELLEMGADDTVFDLSKKDIIRARVRKKMKIKDDDFVVVTGGKITKLKNTHLLMEAISLINNNQIKLILFGSIDVEMNPHITELSSNQNIFYINWLSTTEIYDILFASDLGFFPGQHSVLWEQFLGVGLPCVFKKWEGMEHLNYSNNCMYLDEISNQKISEIIVKLYTDKSLYKRLKENSEKYCINHFSYSNIAKRSIEN